MQDFIITLLTCSLTMSVVALLYMTITPVLNKRYSPRGRYYAWLAIVLGLIIPFRPQFANAIATVNVPVIESAYTRIVNTAPIITAETSSAVPVIIPWWQIAAAVLIAGMVAAMAYHMIKHFRFVKTVNRWSESVAGERLNLLHELKTEMGISKRIGLYQCSSVESPMLIGLVKPRLLLPDNDFSPDELRFVLTHELVHYRRKDLYYKCLVLLATCIHWFNPVVYLMAKAINTACELSCDAEVVRSTGSDTRLNYGETIISLARHQSKLRTSLSTNFYGGMKGMKKRLFSIMDTNKKRIGVAVVCAAVIASLGTGFILMAHASENAGNAAEMPASLAADSAFEGAFEGASSSDAANGDTDANYVHTVSASLQESIEPYKHLGLSVDESIGAVMYEGHPVREIFDPVTGELITESMGANAFNGRELANAVDLTVLYESDEPVPSGFSVSTQEEFDARTEERRRDVSYAFDGDEAEAALAAESGTQMTPDELEKEYSIYEPFGVTYDKFADEFFYGGKLVREFMDMLASNGEIPGGGNFSGSLRQHSNPDGEIDINTVRDYTDLDSNGYGKLMGIEVVE